MGFDFYLKTALKNIRNNKRQASILVFSIFISISLPISIRLWSLTAEDLAAQDFLENQDFDLHIRLSDQNELPFILDWLETEPLVKESFQLYVNIACFNAENKPGSYMWYPEDAQENMSDPISLTQLALFPKSAVERIQNQFYIRGSSDIGINECLISEYEALELERIYGYPIEPGMNFTLSVARDSPELGVNWLGALDLKHYQNITIKGIYRPIPSVTMLQKIYTGDFLRDSVIFTSENLDEITLLELNANGINPKLMIKANIELLKADGISNILNKIQDLDFRLDNAFLSYQSEILESPYKELEQSYFLAQSSVIFMIPVIVTSAILMLFTTNIIIEKNKEHFTTLKDRGGLNWQIIGITLLEFLILIIIGFIIGVATSFIISAFIPTIASGSFSGSVFKLFILNSQFPFTLSLYLLLGTMFIIGVFLIIKMRLILVNKLEERRTKRRERFQISAIVISALAALGFTLGYLLKLTIESQQEIKNLFFFNVEQSEISMQIFLLMTVLIMALIFIVTFAFYYLLGKIKWLYNYLFKKNSFFVSNSLNKSKSKLSILLIVFILISSINVFSLNLYHTLKNNEEVVKYYNNGSDLRIHTSFVDVDYALNISQNEGIDEVMPITKAFGKPIYTSATVYGIDPIVYSRIGRWDIEYENLTVITSMLNNLNQTDDGAIISDYVANRYNYTIGESLTIANLPNTTATGSYESFIVLGIIKSAPGLGLAYGMNIELYQPNDEFILINSRTMINKYAVRFTNLFFASVKQDYSIDNVKEDLMSYSDVIDINPESVNPQFVGEFIDQYIPNVRAFILIQLILMNFIGLIITALSLDFILKQRDQSNAILQTLGNSNTNLSHLVVSELLIVEITAFITALIIGIPFSYFCVVINRPSFFAHNIISIDFMVNFLGIFGFFAILLIFTIVLTLPLLVRFSKKNIAKILRDV
ncbi:MAG: FtsX-like permease family protein [Asgard group archaeon]|nr:FtsX-like permease family protein [Asgard group archaeon]